MDVVDLDETAVGRMILKPGWRWSTDVAPKMGTSTCQVRHLGAALSGHLHVVVEDGSEMDIQGGDVYEIPPGHDGWVVGDVPWEAVEFASARVYGATDDETGVRSLGTILMTDIVGSTAALERVGDAKWHSPPSHTQRANARADRPVRWPGDADDRRRVPGAVHRCGPRRSLRSGHDRRRLGSRHPYPRGFAHRRRRTGRREPAWDSGARRGPHQRACGTK